MEKFLGQIFVNVPSVPVFSGNSKLLRIISAASRYASSVSLQRCRSRIGANVIETHLIGIASERP